MRKHLMILVVLLALFISGCDEEPTTPVSSATCVPAQSLIAPYALPNLPPVTAEDWSRGPETARITLIVYSDYQ